MKYFPNCDSVEGEVYTALRDNTKNGSGGDIYVVALHTYFVHKQGREKRQEISWCVILRDRKTSGKRKKFEQTEDNFVALWPGHQAGAVIFKHVTHETVRYWYKELPLF